MRNTTILNSASDFPIKKVNFPLIVFYDTPSDFPDKYVARLFDIEKPTEFAMISDSLEELKKSFMSIRSWARMPRQKNDDPNIIEVWI